MDIIIAFLLLIVPFALVGLWWWFGTMCAIGLVVGLAELVAVIRKKRTISQMFWRWAKENKVRAWMVLVSLSAGWSVVMLHLVWKIL